jgi:MFS family permease
VENLGSASGTMQTSASVGSLLGPPLAGLLIGSDRPVRVTLVVAILVCSLGTYGQLPTAAANAQAVPRGRPELLPERDARCGRDGATGRRVWPPEPDPVRVAHATPGCRPSDGPPLGPHSAGGPGWSRARRKTPRSRHRAAAFVRTGVSLSHYGS